ncbi:GMC family oxidoreductase [Marinobacterium arenosum]|uniref:GMC family oxidoreductase n=1 Tax=Marinobacterium arenosum TaxID=2862496 RepID=UPI001C942078|nr:GMC family oxidoreductase [Marinobacterium arenosum]MBY4677038.1 GMC family oxidoreductase [Marinobacterium arenosum]
MKMEQQPQELIDADVVIIGAGVVGGLMAWRLSEQGLNVAVLDAGARVDRVDAINRYKANPDKEANSPYRMMPWAPVPDDKDPLSYYVQPGLAKPGQPQQPKQQIAFAGFFMRLVGGTSWHWTGHAERLYPNDFRTRSAYGVGVDWPLSYDELEPYYYQVEQAWGVAGDADCVAPPRKDPYPLPVVPRSYLDIQVGKVAQAVIGHDTQPLPHCRNSLPYDDRPQCCGNASCLPICPIGAKYDAHVHVLKAEQQGSRVLANRVAVQVALDESQQQVTGIYYRNFDQDAKGSLGLARAKIYVLAAHAVETPRLMLLSAGKENVPAAGLSNSSGQVGRNLMGFANINTVGYAPADNPVYPYRGPVSATGAIGGWRDGEFRKEYASIAPFTINGAFKFGTGPLDEAAQAIDEGYLGSALRQRVDEMTARQVNLHSTVEVMPNPDNRVSLAYDQLDPLGLPRPKLDFKLDDYTLRGCRVAWDAHLKIFNQMGVARRDGGQLQPNEANWQKLLRGELDKTYYSLTSGDAVIAGTVRMGDDPASAVVDRHCRSFDHQNLYIVGTCNYPTIGSASPSLTAAALGLRSADQIAANFFKD